MGAEGRGDGGVSVSGQLVWGAAEVVATLRQWLCLRYSGVCWAAGPHGRVDRILGRKLFQIMPSTDHSVAGGHSPPRELALFQNKCNRKRCY